MVVGLHFGVSISNLNHYKKSIIIYSSNVKLLFKNQPNDWLMTTFMTIYCYIFDMTRPTILQKNVNMMIW